MKNIHLNTKKGFSLIEVIVVISVVAFVLPAIFGIVFSVLKQQIQVYKLTEVKRQGDSALTTIQNLVRPVEGVYSDDSPIAEVCVTGPYPPASGGYSNGENMYFKNKNSSNYFRFYLNNRTLMYDLVGNATPLTNNKVEIVSFQIACQRSNSYTPSILVLKFDMCYKTNPPTNPPCQTEDALTYSTRIVLRNN